MNRFARIIAIAATLTSTALLTGCASSQGMNNIHVGMTKQEVIQVLGSPQSVSAQGDKEILKYNLFAGATAIAWQQDYYVGLVQGRVVAFGQ